MHFQDLILKLQDYWNKQGCLLIQPYDMEKGAATFNPATFLRSLGPEPFNAAFAEPCRRPADGRYGENPIRMQHYYQFQVVMKPSPLNILDLYLGSLQVIGIDPLKHDIRFVHDDWESPTLGAWGLGWEVWLNGMEITQFTYFQQVGGIELAPITGEITYGLERLCLYLQGKKNVFELSYNQQFSYGDVFHQNEVQYSKHNFEIANTEFYQNLFDRCESECKRICELQLPAPAYDYCIKASHAFNLLDARGAISVNERQGYILRVRTLARLVAETWLKHREELKYPLLKNAPVSGVKPFGNEKILAAAKAFNISSMESVTAPVLIELGLEEMPAQVFKPLLQDLPKLLEKYLQNSRLEPEDVNIWLSPRRIVISIASVKCKQADQRIELKGPPARIAKDAQGNWTKAAEAFAKKSGLELSQLQLKSVDGTDILFAEIDQKGITAIEFFAKLIPKFFGDIHWYKTMRWGSETTPFVRPVQWLVAMLGDSIIPCEFAGIPSGDLSRGHRFLFNKSIKVTAEKEAYLASLSKAFCVVDHVSRKEKIREQLLLTAKKNNLQWREDQNLLDHVNFLVEWPVPVLGSFPEHLLEIPDEVLVSEMREHQKYFALNSLEGSLSNFFIAMSNMVCEDMSNIRKGNENVLLSRFADAAFFLKEDKQKKLIDRLEKLKSVTFSAELGAEASLWHKVQRVTRLSDYIAETLGLNGERRVLVKQIAELCKTDLTTAMVGEFPELQGYMGQYYAMGEGLNPIVAKGISGQYKPRNAEDGFPESEEAAIVGLADRMDSLASMFSIGKAPTGSADPFALRRACWSAIALIVNKGFRLDIAELIAQSLKLIPPAAASSSQKGESKELGKKLLDFFQGRAQRLFQEAERPGIPAGCRADTVEAVMKSSQPWTDFSDLAKRLQAMEAFRRQSQFDSVTATFKRVSNILNEPIQGEASLELCSLEAERDLYKVIQTVEQNMAGHLKVQNYIAVLSLLPGLQKSVTRFFEEVRVNDEDGKLKLNRQRLLNKVRQLVIQVADFSALSET